MIFQLFNGPLVIEHEEEQPDWVTIQITLDDEAVANLEKIAKMLEPDGITMNDILVSIIKNEIQRHLKEEQDDANQSL